MRFGGPAFGRGRLRARRALALSMAQEAQEEPRLEDAARRIADLEDRTRQALAAGRDDLATEAAEAIAGLEAEQGARRNAQALFSAEAARLRRIVADTEARLADLDRGRRDLVVARHLAARGLAWDAVAGPIAGAILAALVYRGAEVDLFEERTSQPGAGHGQLTTCFRAEPPLTRAVDRLFARLGETARYMLGRVEVNRAQIDELHLDQSQTFKKH